MAAVAAVLIASSAGAQSIEAFAGMQAYNRGDISNALRLLQNAASANDPEGQVNLGYMYARGQGVFADQQKAFQLYQLSALQGDSEGMNAIGYKYLHGTGVFPDPQKAVHWFCKAIALGNARAMNNLADMLDAGDHVTKDEDEARNLWEQAAALGHSNAMMNLSSSYALGPKADQAKAQQWLVAAARRGNPLAEQVLQESGYKGKLPAPFDETAMMIPVRTGASGHSKFCATIS